VRAAISASKIASADSLLTRPDAAIKVYRTDKTFICPKCKVFANRDPVSLQTHAKNCKAVYSGPSDPPAPPASKASAKPKSRRAKPTPRLYAADQMTVDADGKPVALAPVEGAEGSATLASGPQAADEPTASKVWMCARCDPPLPLKSESDRAMHYR
jgi:ribosomal protein L37AE/L43A